MGRQARVFWVFFLSEVMVGFAMSGRSSWGVLSCAGGIAWGSHGVAKVGGIKMSRRVWVFLAGTRGEEVLGW